MADNKEKEFPSNKEIIIPEKNLPSIISIIPTSERPLFPPQAIPIISSSPDSVRTVNSINESESKLGGILLCRTKENEPITINDFYNTGSIFRIHNPVKMGNKIQFVAEGITRFKIVKWISTTPPFIAQVEYPKTIYPKNPLSVRAYSVAIINTLKELTPLNPLYSEELKFFLNRFITTEPSSLTDFAASLTTASKEELQEILDTLDLVKRMHLVVNLIKKEVEVIKIQAKIFQQVENIVSEQQRKFFLKEQLKVIQKELGISKDDRTADKDRFDEKIDKLDIPDDVLEEIDEEMEKLSILELGSPEYAVTRNYLEIITSLPWGIYSKDKLNLERARKILDRAHEGLKDVKNRILEFIAVGALRGNISGTIILLVGPPGVGKTSIGRSIAEAVGRKFFRFSVGGMRDEAEIKGHRRTYIGSMPGKLIQALSRVKVANPVIMIDEIDKLTISYHGDPAAALLEVLDPEQNSDFLDHYLDVRFDLSKVLFVCTANQLDTIPQPLLDRMEVIRLSGYLTDEKIEIASKHLWPRQRKLAGLKSNQVKMSKSAIRTIVEQYAREAGLRNLEKQLGKITRKVALQLVSKKATKAISIKEDDVKKYLGMPLFPKEELITGVGVVTGLAWTAMGGATLSIEANKIHSIKRGFKLTGKLGSTMRESAEIAYSFIAANAKEFSIKPSYFDDAYIHLHVPEGATPKDGPSAGITMASALLSLARNKKIRSNLAMTGELTLTGEVLAVGGILEKLIAAKRAKINEIILPKALINEYKELPKHVTENLKVHFVANFREVAKILFS